LDPYREAIVAFDQAIALDPAFAAAYALKGYALLTVFSTIRRPPIISTGRSKRRRTARTVGS
jgi:hypothetical protein